MTETSTTSITPDSPVCACCGYTTTACQGGCPAPLAPTMHAHLRAAVRHVLDLADEHELTFASLDVRAPFDGEPGEIRLHLDQRHVAGWLGVVHVDDEACKVTAHPSGAMTATSTRWGRTRDQGVRVVLVDSTPFPHGNGLRAVAG